MSKSSKSYNLSVVIHCKHCGGAFHPKWTRETSAKWCSRTCMAADRKRGGEKFWKFFEEMTTRSDASACWEWQGHVTSQGYGAVMLDGKIKRAHRLSYEKEHGVIPEGMLVCHRCDNRRCVNPSHLFLGDHKANMADMAAKDRHKFGLTNGGYKRRKLTPEQVRLIRQDGRAQREIAKDFGISGSNVWDIKNHRTYANVP